MWTDYTDVENRWVGGGFPADEALVTTLIGDAEDTILAEFPTIQDRIDIGDLPLSRVQKVVAKMVMRHLRNPKGHRQTTDGAGPFQQSVTYGGDEPGSIYLNDADRAELAPRTSLKGKAFSVEMTPQTGYNTYPPDSFVWETIQ